jgi:hypothetical protein
MLTVTIKARHLAILAVLALLVVVMGSSCGDSSSGDGQKVESGTQQSNYDRLVAQDPAHTMDVSPTRNTINFWIDTWGKNPDKLAYIYMLDSTGQTTGYYILKGLPVSYCVGITPPYKIIQDQNDNGQMAVPAPSIDAAYYGGGGACNTYYGRDASSGSYVEFTVNAGQGYRLFDRPLALPSVKPLAFATIENVKP